MPKLISIILPPVLVFIGILILWKLSIILFSIPPYNLPSPGQVLESMNEYKDDLFKAFLTTGLSALTGFSISLVFGYGIALILAQSKWIERSFMPYAIFFQTVPIVAIAPLIIQWVGYGPKGVVLVVSMISIFPIIANTHIGLTRIQKDYQKLFKLYRAKRLQLLLHLQIPHSIPHLLAGARISCGLAVIGAIVGEFFTGYNDSFGLGYLIEFSGEQLKTGYLFACIISSTLLGFMMFSIVNIISFFLLKRYQRTHSL